MIKKHEIKWFSVYGHTITRSIYSIKSEKGPIEEYFSKSRPRLTIAALSFPIPLDFFTAFFIEQ